MDAFFSKLSQDEPPVDPNDTEKLPPPIFPLAGLGAMVTLVSPDGREHWVQKGSMVFKLMRSHGYRVKGGAS